MLFVWIFFICHHTDLVTVPPTESMPTHKLYTFQQEDNTVVKNFQHILGLGPFKCYVTLFFWKLDPHPPPRNANNIEQYTFVTLFSRKGDTPHPHLRYVTLEWPLYAQVPNNGSWEIDITPVISA